MVDVTPSTCGGFTGEIQLTVQGDPADFDYQWSGNISIGLSATGLGADTYNVTVSRVGDANCSTELVIIVPNSDGPAVTVGNVTDATCDNGGTASLSPNTLSFNWSDGGTGADRNNLMPGTFSVTATDLATNCTNVIAVTIGNGCATGCTDVPTVSITGTDASCGSSDGSAAVTVTSGSSEYMYTWTNNVSTTETAINLPAGVFGVTTVSYTHLTLPTIYSV